MRTLREKITFLLTVTVYFLCHLKLGADLRSSASATIYQLLLTAPYAIGFTYITASLFKKIAGVDKLPWDRYVRIFCTIGILFGFFFALYEYAGGEEAAKAIESNVSDSYPHDIPKPQLYLG